MVPILCLFPYPRSNRPNALRVKGYAESGDAPPEVRGGVTDISGEDREIRARVGYMSENETLVPGLTSVGFVALAAEDRLSRVHEQDVVASQCAAARGTLQQKGIARRVLAMQLPQI